MRSRSNGGVIGAYALPSQNYANGVFFIHDAAIYNTGVNPIWPLAAGFIYSATGGTISTAADNSNYKIHTFTANGTFTVTTGASELEILLVGGGGTGGTIYAAASYDLAGGGGGGGGGVTLVRTWVNPGTTFTVTVGVGGTNPRDGTSGAVTNSYNGANSLVVRSDSGVTYYGYGGTTGGGFSGSSISYKNGRAGSGPGGGGAASAVMLEEGLGKTASNSSGGGINYYLNSGGNGGATTTTVAAGGGGGGAGGFGYDGDYSVNAALAAYGGDGWLWSRTNALYGAGGGGGRTAYKTTTSALAGLAGPSPGTRVGSGGYSSVTSSVITADSGTGNFGRGGGGGVVNDVTNNNFGYGGNGGAGTVIFCYRYK